MDSAPLAIAVILATFPEAEQEATLKLPFPYAMTALCVGSVITLTYRRFSLDLNLESPAAKLTSWG